MNIFKGRINHRQYVQAALVLALSFFLLPLGVMVIPFWLNFDEMSILLAICALIVLAPLIFVLAVGLSRRRRNDQKGPDGMLTSWKQYEPTQAADAERMNERLGRPSFAGANRAGEYVEYASVWHAILGILPHEKNQTTAADIMRENTKTPVRFFTDGKLTSQEVRDITRPYRAAYHFVNYVGAAYLWGVFLLFHAPLYAPAAFAAPFLYVGVSFLVIVIVLILICRRAPRKFLENPVLGVGGVCIAYAALAFILLSIHTFSFHDCASQGKGIDWGAGFKSYQCIEVTK